MPMKAAAIISYVNGKRYKKAQPKSHDFTQYAPHIVPNDSPGYE